VHAELRQDGIRVARKRVERLMRAAGLSGQLRRRRPKKTTISVPGVRLARDLVQRDFSPPAPNRLWVADLTCVATAEGWLYLAAVLDCFSRRIVGWSMAERATAGLVVDALEMAVAPAPGTRAHPPLRPGHAGRIQVVLATSDDEGCDGTSSASCGGSCEAAADAIAGSAVDGAGRGAAAVLAGDRGRLRPRTGPCPAIGKAT
jgi:hypothetical protein